MIEREKRLLAQERRNMQEKSDVGCFISENIVATLFRNANNPLTLRKRYRDLVKVFHPDNLLGDEELMQMINKEYSKRREEM